ncbi:hypothetical protein Bbelb_079840 [Branchiostoma belcheri]|nr:hypothetical protein Bbelb_079840 [Branchiostoma belcheri]
MAVPFWLLICLFGVFAEANTSLEWFDFYDAKAINSFNYEGIGGINEEECARRCLVGTPTVPFGSCLSFDYDHQLLRCTLSTANRNTPGATLADSDPPSRFDYYERKAPYSPCTLLCSPQLPTVPVLYCVPHSSLQSLYFTVFPTALPTVPVLYYVPHSSLQSLYFTVFPTAPYSPCTLLCSPQLPTVRVLYCVPHSSLQPLYFTVFPTAPYSPCALLCSTQLPTVPRSLQSLYFTVFTTAPYSPCTLLCSTQLPTVPVLNCVPHSSLQSLSLQSLYFTVFPKALPTVPVLYCVPHSFLQSLYFTVFPTAPYTPYSPCTLLCSTQLPTVPVLNCVPHSSLQSLYFTVFSTAPYSPCTLLCSPKRSLQSLYFTVFPTASYSPCTLLCSPQLPTVPVHYCVPHSSLQSLYFTVFSTAPYSPCALLCSPQLPTVPVHYCVPHSSLQSLCITVFPTAPYSPCTLLCSPQLPTVPVLYCVPHSFLQSLYFTVFPTASYSPCTLLCSPQLPTVPVHYCVPHSSLQSLYFTVFSTAPYSPCTLLCSPKRSLQSLYFTVFPTAPYSPCTLLCSTQLPTVPVLNCVPHSSLQSLYFTVFSTAPYSPCTLLCSPKRSLQSLYFTVFPTASYSPCTLLCSPQLPTVPVHYYVPHSSLQSLYFTVFSTAPYSPSPYSPCDFETDRCQYTQDTTDNFNWKHHSGGTASSHTGPTVDHTTGTSLGHYMYIETSAPRQQGDTARLLSPSYRRYPDGTLKVSVKTGGTTSDIWTRSGNQGDQWFSVAVSIPANNSYQVIFEGVRGSGIHGDIAIDDVSILQRTCLDVVDCVPRQGRGLCAHICTNSDNGFSCSCNVGYSLHQDGLSCNDNNECSSNEGRGPCDHICTNTVGSYTCSCDDDYILHSDRHVCDHPSSPLNISRQEDHNYCDVSWSSPAVPRGRGNITGYNDELHRIWRDHVGIRPRYAGRGGTSKQVYLQRDYLDSNEQTQRGEYSVKSTESTSIRLLKSTKREILDLLPNSVYTIKVTGLTYTGEGYFSQAVTCTVPPGKPPAPEKPVLQDQTELNSTTLPIEVKPTSDRHGPIGCYHVIVVKSSSTNNLPDPEMLHAYKTLQEAKNSGNANFAYIAMALTPDTVGASTTVTVGDGTVTSCNLDQAGRKRRALTSDDVYYQEYTNSPLEPDSSYTTSVRAYGQDDGGQPYFSASPYMDPVSTGMIGLGAASAVLLIALVAAVAVIAVLKRRNASLKSKREARGTTVQNDAFDDTYYTDTRTNRTNQDGTYCNVMDGRSTKRQTTRQDGEYDMPDVSRAKAVPSREEGAYQTLDPRTLETGNNEYETLRK